jgi:thiamine-phosphate pyrophosphorylase
VTVWHRILDANLNRAREGLRVLEDIVRFALDDAAGSAVLKSYRHRLDRATRTLYSDLVSSRDSAADVGRGRDEAVKRGRGIDDVAAANLRRVQEALRSIEECSRGRQPRLAREAHDLRYRCYELEATVVPRAWRRALLEDVRLYLLAVPSIGPLSRVREAVAGGVGMVQLRHKGASSRQLLRETRQLKKLGVPVIVNDRVDLAAEAHGVHLGEEDVPVKEARKLLGERKIIGATTHSLSKAREMIREGADYISVGPMFETSIKPELKPTGFRYVRQAAKLNVPAFCIGGIKSDNVRKVIRAGGRRVAVCSAILSSRKPRAAARQFRQALGR